MTATDSPPPSPAKIRQRAAKHGRMPALGPNAQEVQALTAHFGQSQYVEAESLALSLTHRFPHHSFGWMALGSVYKQWGRGTDALTAMQRAVEFSPDDANAHTNLGAVLQDLGRFNDAEASLQHALRIEPHNVQALCNLGVTLQAMGRTTEAETILRRALRLQPGNAMTQNNLGNTLKGMARLDDAVVCYQQAVRLQPDFVEAHYNLGVALLDLGRFADAETSSRRALHFKPDHMRATYNLGLTLMALGRPEAAEISYRQAVALDPEYVDAHNNLGVALLQQGRLLEAEASYRRAIEIRPDYAEAHSNLGATLQDLGRLDEAEASYRRALTIDPASVGARNNLLFVTNYHPDKSDAEVFAVYREIGASFTVRDITRHLNPRNTQRRLRVGYVSGDFKHHPARHFIEPLLAHHDKQGFEVFAYAELMTEDSATVRYKKYVDHWIPTRGLSDAALAERIRADAIDILVDLAGHTQGNRLGVFALKPSPVSVTWIGCGYTTGLSAIDYLLTDETSAPVGSEHYYSEQPWRIATPLYAYAPADGMGDVSVLPALNAGHITFGTLSRAIRINHRVIRVWSEILKRVPGSQLVIDSRDYRSEHAQALLAEKFAVHGIARDRLRMGCHSPPWDVLRSIDIGLDCFPHNSGTTLFESLYMGVPFITLAGRPSLGRLGSSILNGAGHPEWIAQREEDYIAKAIALATDLPTLQNIRTKLRSELQASPLLDQAGFTRRVEAAYRDMFLRWAQSDTSDVSNIEQQLEHALSLHNAGQLQQAGEQYRAILEADPNHVKANFNMGVLAVQMLQPVAGLPFFAAALDAEPTSAPLWIGYIDALYQAGQKEDARQLLNLARQQGLEGHEVEVLSVKLALHETPDATAPRQQRTTLSSETENPTPRQLNAVITLITEGKHVEAIANAQALTERFTHHASSWIILGMALDRTGRSAEALVVLRKAVDLEPRNADAHLNLGVTLKNLGRQNEAHDCYRTALQMNPDLAEAHYNLGNTLKDLSQFGDAASSYRKALRWLPKNAVIHNNLGATLLQLGQLKEAESSLRRAVKLQPNFADAHFNLGRTLLSADRLNNAESSFRRAIELNPHHAQALFSLGSIQKARGQLIEAEANYQRALQITPYDAKLLTVLGGIQIEMNHGVDAEANYRRAIQIEPHLVEAHNNLANIFVRAGRTAEAEPYLRQALAIKPDYAEAHYNLGNVLMELSRMVEARDCFKRALALNPEYLPAQQNLVTLTAYLSDFDDLVAASDATLQLDPNAVISWEQRLYTFSYHPDLSAEQIFAEFVRWGDRFPAPATDFSAHDRTPGRRLRIGFVSPDLRRHTSRFFFFPLFENHDHAVVELIAYSNVLNEDDVTQKFIPLFDHWRNIRGVADQDVARMIREDQIDILVDGCNHMLDDRLGVFTLKPAPIQVTWLGAAWTTGLKQIDYVLFDPTIAPEGTLARETIVHLPHCFIAYQPEGNAPVAPTPALKNGHITFGYSGRTERLNHHTFRVWGEIQRRMPDARMIFDYRCFADPATQDYYRELMRQHGMDTERVVMRRSENIFLGLHDFDVLLDCFPHSGGTMLFDALWMGVPCLTLTGRPPLGCIGTTLMSNLGMTEWITQSHEEYINKAIELTKDVHKLAALRAGVRARLQASPIMDGKGFARDVENAYRTMYEKWIQT